MDFGEEPRDYGFDKSDVRWSAILKDESRVNVIIVRNRRYNEDEELEWDMHFEVQLDGEKVAGPMDDDATAVSVAKVMFKTKIDKKATDSLRADIVMQRMEERLF